MKALLDDYAAGQLQAVYLCYTRFINTMKQEPVVQQLLPLHAETLHEKPAEGAASHGWDYLYEPDPQTIFRDLLPRHVQVQVYRALLESNAAFFAAQMTAMDAATRNSAEMLENLTLYMNRVRQAASRPG